MALITKQAETIDKGIVSRVDFFRNKRKEALEEGSNGKSRTTFSERQPQKHSIDPADKPPTDFFGRPIIIERVTLDSQPLTKCNVVYRFKEGNSSAVRKPVKVQAFLYHENGENLVSGVL
ncbi:hypothetical protein Clacol_006804 [Clathrus columnatus]|uniref:Uncharacterized protein n=1 Tax=Clathrus columnatus TaxID=1419009 RepID=A0AAV5AJA7_9AGAM|nr:hypothetical protein Clacol_006804 [Clathrus columnatus]